jgi:hypothetical protein
MENLWESFEEEEIKFNNPKTILENQAEYLKKMTDGLVGASIRKLNIINEDKVSFINDIKISPDFIYSITITSSYVENYQFNILKIIYGIKIYPLCIKVNEEVEHEIEEKYFEAKKYKDGQYIIYSEDEFVNILKVILNSKEIRTIIRNLKLIAQEAKEDEYDMPF